MGIYYDSYMGPFMRVPITKQPASKEVYVDANGKETENKFDPETGKKNNTKIIPYMKEIIPDAYIDDDDAEGLQEDAFTDARFNDKEVLFYPNSGEFDDLGHVDTEYDYHTSLYSIDPDKSMMRFKRKYKKYIDYFENLYGPMEIDYGIIRYGR